jgi:hypothetical protein
MMTTTRVEDLVRQEVEQHEPLGLRESPREIVSGALSNILDAVAEHLTETGNQLQKGRAALERILRLVTTALLDLEHQ